MLQFDHILSNSSHLPVSSWSLQEQGVKYLYLSNVAGIELVVINP